MDQEDGRTQQIGGQEVHRQRLHSTIGGVCDSTDVGMLWIREVRTRRIQDIHVVVVEDDYRYMMITLHIIIVSV